MTADDSRAGADNAGVETDALKNEEITVLVLAGGLSHERDVSLRSGRRVAEALRRQGFSVVESDVNSDLVSLLQSTPRVVAVPLLHGETGEDGALREVLWLCDVPYVGATPTASRITFDKSIATTVVRRAGLQTPAQVALPAETFRELGARPLVEAMGRRLQLPMMVKPSRSGSALGASKVTEAAELPSAMVHAYAYGSVAVVESFIEGTEVAVTVLDRGNGPEALPAVEIRPDSGTYDYASRYTAGATEFVTPAEVDDATAQACADLALAAHRALGLRDLSRTDIIIDKSTGVPHFIEGNVAPGLTETSLVPIALEAAGLDLGEVMGDLVRRAKQRHNDQTGIDELHRDER